jgi:hypothetical protein
MLLEPGLSLREKAEGQEQFWGSVWPCGNMWKTLVLIPIITKEKRRNTY